MSNTIKGQVGNTSVAGFVNFVSEDNTRFVLGTGSYPARDGSTVFKSSVTVFIHQDYDGRLPVKGDALSVRGDLRYAASTHRPGELDLSMNLRFANQAGPAPWTQNQQGHQQQSQSQQAAPAQHAAAAPMAPAAFDNFDFEDI